MHRHRAARCLGPQGRLGGVCRRTVLSQRSPRRRSSARQPSCAAECRCPPLNQHLGRPPPEPQNDGGSARTCSSPAPRRPLHGAPPSLPLTPRRRGWLRGAQGGSSAAISPALHNVQTFEGIDSRSILARILRAR
jgi:hypothetical protein